MDAGSDKERAWMGILEMEPASANLLTLEPK
jgi:hypothetical protein